MSEKVFCPECGTPVSTGDVFCPECGKKLADSVPKKTEQENLVNEAPEKASGSFWTRLFTVMTNIVLVFACLILLLCFYLTSNESDISYAIIGIMLFVTILYSVSIAMVFSSMAQNIEKVTNHLFDVHTCQKMQAEQLEKLISQFKKGEH